MVLTTRIKRRVRSRSVVHFSNRSVALPVKISSHAIQGNGGERTLKYLFPMVAKQRLLCYPMQLSVCHDPENMLGSAEIIGKRLF